MPANHNLINFDQDQLVVVPFLVRLQKASILLCLNVQKVIEVIEAGQLSPLPQDQQPFIGVYKHRLGPIPVLNIHEIIESAGVVTAVPPPRRAAGDQKRILFCHLHEFIVGIQVDHTKRIMRVKGSDVQPVPQPLQGRWQKFSNGMIPFEGQYMHMLDLENILHTLGVRLDRSEEKAPEQVPWLKGKRILVVEDSELFRRKSANIFTAQGATCEFAHDGRAGLELLQRRSPPFDLIFTDIEMPYMNGIEMIRKIKEIQKDFAVPVIFNSSIANEAMIREIEEEELGVYLVKFDGKSITATVNLVSQLAAPEA